MSRYVSKQRSVHAFYRILLLCVMMAGKAYAQESKPADTLRAQYENLRIQYEGSYRDTAYFNSLRGLIERAKEKKLANEIVTMGLQNWPNYNVVGYFNFVIDDIRFVKEELRITNLPTEQWNSLNLMLLEAFTYTRNLPEGQALAQEIISNAVNDKVASTARGYLSTLYVNAGRYRESAELLFENLLYFEAVNDTSSQIGTLNNLAQLHETINNNSLALELYKKAEALTVQLKDPERELLILSSLGVFYKNLDNFEQATAYYLRAIELSETLNDLSASAQNNFNLGNIYYEEGSFDLASERYDIAYKIVDELNFEYPKALIAMMRGTLLLDLNALNPAEQYFLEAERILTGLNDLDSQIYLGSKLADLYDKQGDFKAALAYSQQVVEGQKQKIREGSLDSLNQQLVNYQIRQSELLDENQRIEEKRARQINIFTSMLVLVFGIGFVTVLIQNQKKKILIEKLFASAKNEFTKPLEQGREQFSISSHITLDIFKVELAKTTETGNRRELFIEIFKLVIADELYKDIDLGLSQLAKHAKSNTAYVSEAINSNLEMGYNSFINRIRTKKAQYLLLNTNMIIEDVMEECGYRNRSTFYRAFQNETGLTPGEYIQKKKAEHS